MLISLQRLYFLWSFSLQQIRTVIQPTLDEVIILAVIVAIRTVVGYSLDKEAKDILANQ